MEALTQRWRHQYRSPEELARQVLIPDFHPLPDVNANTQLQSCSIDPAHLLPDLPAFSYEIDALEQDFIRSLAINQPSEQDESEVDEPAEAEDYDDPDTTFEQDHAEDEDKDTPSEFDEFDAIVNDHLGTDLWALDSRDALLCLSHALHGRSSALVAWDDSTARFRITAPDRRLSGATLEASQALFTACAASATAARRIELVAEGLRAKTREASASATAIVTARFIADLLHLHGNALALPGDESIAVCDLDRALMNSHKRLHWLTDLLLVDTHRSSCIARSVRAFDGKVVLDRLWRSLTLPTEHMDHITRVLQLSYLHDLTAVLVREISAAATLGTAATGLSNHEMVVLRRDESGSLFIDTERAPACLTPQAQSLLLECIAGTSVLKHADARQLDRSFNPTFSTIVSTSVEPLPTTKIVTASAPSGDIEAQLAASLAQMSLIPSQTTVLQAFKSSIDRITTSKHMPLSRAWDLGVHIPLQLHVAALKHHVTDALMNRVKLLDHIDLLREVYLFGNGKLVSSLSNVIFAEPRSLAALARGGPGLISVYSPAAVKQWPPPTAKVAVALRNVLAQTLTDERFLHQATATQSEPELLGHLGFRVEEPDSATTSETKVGSIDALSFLRFRYRSPRALQGIITPASIRQYDMISQFLLLLLRCSHAVTKMSRAHTTGERRHLRREHPVSERFRLEAAAFVRAVTAHAFETAVAANWSTFRASIAAATSSTTISPSVADLRHMHDLLLDRIAAGLLLNRRAKEIHALLRTALQAALDLSHMSIGDREAPESQQSLYENFHKVAVKLVRVCEASAATGRGRLDGNSPVAGLAVRLAMNGYWSS
ncbi:hypothetical protein PYCC9005_004333 [Savitreella phatthalungensis]